MEFSRYRSISFRYLNKRARADGAVLSLWLALGVLFASPAAAQHCTDSSVPGTLIGFTPLPGVIEKPNSCNLLPCYKPEEDGGAYLATDGNCDALSGVCPVRLRVPLKFPGNSQVPNNGHVRVYWFDQATPDEAACLPPPLGNCSPISICGPLGAEILVDRGETWIQVGASCGSIASGQYAGGSFSVSAYACQTFSGECTERLDVPGLELPSPEAAWELLGCGPPPPPCNSCPCDVGGGPPGFAPNFSGPGALLRYQGKGAGHPGFPGAAEWNTTLGRYWSHDYAERIVMDPDDSHVWLITREAGFHEFSSLADGVYQTVSPSDEYRRLSRIANGWELRDLDGTLQSFDNSGRWYRTEDRNGNATVGSYIDGKLRSVSFPDARNETFYYDDSGRLATIDEVGVDGMTSRRWSYTWSGPDLVRIDRPDGTAWTFRYDDLRHPGFMTRRTLVGTDGGERIDGAWEYDERGNAIRRWKGAADFTSVDAIDKYSFDFDNPFRPKITQVTDPLDVVTTYEIERDSGGTKPRVMRTSGDCSICGAGPNTRQFYEDPQNPLRVTRSIDARNTVTVFQYDENGQLTSRTEAFMDELERTTAWEYDETYPSLVKSIERPSTSGSGVRRTSWTFDGAGNAIVRTEEGVENGSVFRYDTVTVYNTAGQPESIDPPSYGTQDQTKFIYHASRGNLFVEGRTDPLIGTTSFGYDPFNRRTSTTDSNGLTTETVYDLADRVTSVIRRGASPTEDLVTTHVYDEFGSLFRTILPEGNIVEYGYNRVGDLVSIERKPDAATPGDRILYTLNGSGRRTREELQSWNGSAWLTESFTDSVYSSICQMGKIIYSGGAVVELAYDCEGHLERQWDANHPSNNRRNQASTVYAYDALDRLITISRPWGGAGGGTAVLRYDYDVQDHLTRATDANGTITELVYSDRDLIVREVSEVSGISEMEYNSHGRLRRRTDARGVVVEMTNDELGRLVFEDYPEDRLDTTYTYDEPGVLFGMGRLTAIHRNQQGQVFRYDRFGRLIQDGELAYGYDRNGNPTTLSYPGGVAAVYTYDYADRESTLTLQRATHPPQPLVSGAIYKPSGPLSRVALGNGLTELRDFDQRYYPTAIRVSGHLDWSFSTDNMGLITAITNGFDPTSNRYYLYQDFQYFLRTGKGPWGSVEWIYDRAGNRLSEIRDGSTTVFGYMENAAGDASSLLATVGAVEAAEPKIRYFQDSAGHLIQESYAEARVRYRYDSESRLSQIRRDSADALPVIAEFEYDGRSLLKRAAVRIDSQVLQGWETRPTYSSEGLFLHRAVNRPTLPFSLRESAHLIGDDYVFYFAGRPVTLLRVLEEALPGEAPTSREEMLFLTTDHLGVPVLATNLARGAIWSGGFDPFGNDYSGAREAGVLLRFPGQWADELWELATEDAPLHYNVYRWYSTTTGRYLRPDPLGPQQAPNLYSYVSANPVVQRDLLGLQAEGIPSGGIPCTRWNQTDNLLPEPRNNCLPCDQEKISDALSNAAERVNKYCVDPYDDARPYSREELRRRRGGLEVRSGPPTRVRGWIIPGDGQPCIDFCRCSHEATHVGLAQDQIRGVASYTGYYHECEAYLRQIECLLNYKD